MYIYVLFRPCRSQCLEIMKDCEVFLDSGWPTEMSCDSFNDDSAHCRTGGESQLEIENLIFLKIMFCLRTQSILCPIEHTINYINYSHFRRVARNKHHTTIFVRGTSRNVNSADGDHHKTRPFNVDLNTTTIRSRLSINISIIEPRGPLHGHHLNS